MSVLRALDEVGLLSARIMKKISELQLVTTNSSKGRKLDLPAIEAASRAAYQSTVDLITRRQRIKSAIIKSNASTMVTANGVRLTVAEVIDRKKNLSIQKALLEQVRGQRAAATAAADRANAQVEADLQKLLESMGAGAGKNKDFESITSTYRAQHQTTVVDPVASGKLIADLDATIDAFEREAKYTLNESNALTQIEI
jgi:CRISPR/Cas system CMR-associated protein Cmr5 small subunit